MGRKFACFLLCLAAVLTLAACSVPGERTSSEEYILGDELAITMDGGFKASDTPGADVYLFKGDECALYAVRDTKQSLEDLGYDTSVLDLSAYFDLVTKANGITAEEKTSEEAPVASCRRVSGDAEYWYCVTVRECGDAFWSVYLISPAGDGEPMPSFLSDYAASLRVL